MNAKTGVEIEVKPYHNIYEQMETSSRAAFRGEPEPERSAIETDDTPHPPWRSLTTQTGRSTLRSSTPTR